MRTDHLIALLAGAAGALDDAYPNDDAPVVQNALREAAFSLLEGREPSFDAETTQFLQEFTEVLRRHSIAVR